LWNQLNIQGVEVFGSLPFGFLSRRVLGGRSGDARTAVSVLREVFGVRLHADPLLPYRPALEGLGMVSSEEIRGLPHGARARAAGLIECLQSPPTKSGHRVYFLLVEDEDGLLQATLFRSAYQRCGDLLHREGAFLLEGRVERTAARGFAFLVDRARSLREALAGAAAPTPRVAPSLGAFLRAGRRGRKAS